MGEESKVVLHGMWSSAYVKRVELALKIKGIPFDYVEEDLRNKSPLLLKYNPVHKKVPILVHNGKPVCESLVILEYIDETWPNEPQFLPKESYLRAKVRFWAAYIQQVQDSIAQLFNANKEEVGKALAEVHEKLRTLEDGVKDLYFPEGIPDHIQSEKLGMLDAMMVALLGAFKAQDDISGVKIIDPAKNPPVFSWVQALYRLPVVKETIPPHDKLVGFLQYLKQIGFKVPTSNPVHSLN
ncbi:glutathione S-transferase U10-like [Coffea arabica]|uniref:Glutathione S-transferase n=1 Tax=Coffea arabica TaxID=13443 RepID=A0A6P6X8S9_COFAR|nr:glutathione S-transferase U10-like [Coffea arabica]